MREEGESVDGNRQREQRSQTADMAWLQQIYQRLDRKKRSNLSGHHGKTQEVISKGNLGGRQGRVTPRVHVFNPTPRPPDGRGQQCPEGLEAIQLLVSASCVTHCSEK